MSKLTSLEEIVLITYKDADKIRSLYDIEDIEKASLIFLDRYDMYAPKYEKELRELCKSKSILLDYKDDKYLADVVDTCDICLLEGKLEVEGYAFV